MLERGVGTSGLSLQKDVLAAELSKPFYLSISAN